MPSKKREVTSKYGIMKSLNNIYREGSTSRADRHTSLKKMEYEKDRFAFFDRWIRTLGNSFSEIFC